MRKASKKDEYEKQIKQSRECARNRIKFACLGLDYFGMQRFANMGAEVVCAKGKSCLHECRFRRGKK